MERRKALEKIAKRLRLHSLKMTTEAGSGHPTTCLSMAELMACLFFSEMKYDPQDYDNLANDECVLSKGHAAPILWAALAEAGIIPFKKLNQLRKIRSNLEGHPTPRMPWVKTATGSLGQGLSIGVGMALAMRIHRSPARVYVLMGDGECAEGAVWEAANAASYLNLENLVAIVDVNRLGQSQETMHGHDLKAYQRKFKAFGWETAIIDGHNVDEILEAFRIARESGKPFAILAKTIKGKGVSFLEDKNGWHGKALNEEELKKALEELGDFPEIDSFSFVQTQEERRDFRLPERYNFPKTEYKKSTATRRAYGNALLSLGRINRAVVALDGDVKNSTYAEDFFNAFPERAFQCFIAEQSMVGMAMGLSAKGLLPFVATFAAFLSRAHDQIRMAAYSFSNIKFVGSHAGVSIGADGPSQMGLEDMAMFRPIPGCVILYPCDAYSTEACVESLAKQKGLGYLRTTRPSTPLIYAKGEKFPIGGSKILKKSPHDVAAVVAAGITVHEALKAYRDLSEEKIFIRVIDAYSIKPLDKERIITNIEEAGKKAIVVEDHFEGGGLGDAVALALGGRAEIVHLAIKEIPRSGEPDELLDKYGINAESIKKAVREIIRK